MGGTRGSAPISQPTAVGDRTVSITPEAAQPSPSHSRPPAPSNDVDGAKRRRLAGDPYAIRASSAAIAAIDAKLTEAYRTHVGTNPESGAIDPFAAYRELRTMTVGYEGYGKIQRVNYAVGRTLGAIGTLTYEKDRELALRADQFAALHGAAASQRYAEASSRLPYSSNSDYFSRTVRPRELLQDFDWVSAYRRLRW